MSRPAHLELSRYLLSVDPIIAECHFHVRPAVCRDCSAFPHELFQSPVGIVLRAAFIHSRNAVAEVNPFKRLTGQPLPDIALAHFSHFVPLSASAGIVFSAVSVGVLVGAAEKLSPPFSPRMLVSAV